MRSKKNPKLIDVLMPRTRQAILSATLLRPDHEWFPADLARHLHLPPSSLQRELAALVGAGILKARRRGRMLHFRADPDCPIFPELRGLLAKTAGLIDVLRGTIEPFADRIDLAFVYGSVPRGEATSASDIDLMIVGNIGLADLSLPLRAAQEVLGRDLNPKLYHPDEFAKRAASRDHFLTSVLKAPKHFVVGTSHDLDRLT